jgi:hypothetical protein
LEKVQAEELKELKQSSLREKGTLTDVGVTVDFSTETTESSNLLDVMRQENGILMHELELMKSVVEKQLQILSGKEEDYNQKLR